MIDSIPKELLVFIGEHDAELSDEDHGIFLTYVINKRDASKAVIKNRISKLTNRYGDKTGDIIAITLRNRNFTLELPVDTSSLYIPYDTVPIIIHHPDLEEYKNYKIAILVSRYNLLNLLLKTRTVTSGKISGNYIIEFRFGTNLDFVSEIDILEDEDIKPKIELGELLADKSKWTNNVIPGHWYITKESKWLSKSIFLGKYSCLFNTRIKTIDRRSPFSHPDDLIRKDYLIFKESYSDDLNEITFTDVNDIIEFGYWDYKEESKMKKIESIDMGEIKFPSLGQPLSYFINGNGDDFWDSCMKTPDTIFMVPPEEVRKRKDKLIQLARNTYIMFDDTSLKNKLVNLFEFSEIESNEIINELWKYKN